jgi:two-component system, NtrC family, response regulator HydG
MSDPAYSVLVIDRDVEVAEDFGRALSGLAVAVLRAGDWAEGIDLYRECLPQMVLLDSAFDDGEGALQTRFMGDYSLEVVLMTNHWTNEGALAAVARGASDLLDKPLQPSKVRQLILGLIAQLKARRRTQELDNQLLETCQFQGMVGSTPR